MRWRGFGHTWRSWLVKIPLDARLVEAGAPELALLGELFSVLDSDDLPVNARGSILAKVMHRKRPAFIPLYDRFVDYCYRGADDAPVAKDRKRTWREFLPLLGQAIIDDLTSGPGVLRGGRRPDPGSGDHHAPGAGHRGLARRPYPHRSGDLGDANLGRAPPDFDGESDLPSIDLDDEHP